MSEVILDTITGKSTATTITIGSTPVVSASANSMTIRGEGSNQTSIQQGLAKCWANTEQASSYSTLKLFVPLYRCKEICLTCILQYCLG